MMTASWYSGGSHVATCKEILRRYIKSCSKQVSPIIPHQDNSSQYQHSSVCKGKD